MLRIRLAAAAAALLLAACAGREPLYQEQAYVFGTLVDVSVYGEDEARARQAAGEVLREFQRLHDMLHAWQPSELSELNAAFARGEAGAVSPELAAMLQDAAQLAQQSQGLFNPAIGGLVQLWGFHADEFKAALPDGKQVAALVAANPQMSDLVFLPSLPAGQAATCQPAGLVDCLVVPSEGTGGRGRLVQSRNKAVRLDLGGYAKGYALDRAAGILRERGINNALVNIGGNVLALGRHGKRSWRIGIQHPRKPGALAALELHDGEAVGTSGDYQRYFELDGKRYCHLIDPRSGRPAEGVQAATVLTHGARAGVLSDAASKPLFIAGAGGWRAAAERMNLGDAMLVDGQGVIHLTASLRKRLEFADRNAKSPVE